MDRLAISQPSVLGTERGDLRTYRTTWKSRRLRSIRRPSRRQCSLRHQGPLRHRVGIRLQVNKERFNRARSCTCETKVLTSVRPLLSSCGEIRVPVRAGASVGESGSLDASGTLTKSKARLCGQLGAHCGQQERSLRDRSTWGWVQRHSSSWSSSWWSSSRLA